jgi:uncharacterized protein (DUF433 family)
VRLPHRSVEYQSHEHVRIAPSQAARRAGLKLADTDGTATAAFYRLTDMGIPMQSQATLGVGIYSFVDAARFIGSESRDLRRWMLGHTATRDGEKHHYAPLWTSQLAETDIEGVGFRDLIELRFVRTFIASGVPLNLIRRTIDELRERLGNEYPFTSTAFKTDGKRIFMEMLDDNGDKALVDVVKRQNVMGKVIGPSLREGIELNVDDEAMRWYPLPRSKTIVFDPQRSFGQPILSESGVPTIAIAEVLKAEGGDVKRVAALYEVSVADVRKAAAYEAQVAAA